MMTLIKMTFGRSIQIYYKIFSVAVYIDSNINIKERSNDFIHGNKFKDKSIENSLQNPPYLEMTSISFLTPKRWRNQKPSISKH